MISICIPIHDMKDGQFFLGRCIGSIFAQSYKDYEVIITHQGKMAENSNFAIKGARGDLIKVLYMDDYFAHENALKDIVEAFRGGSGEWLITGTDNNPYPYYTDDIHTGNNKLGSPSALTMKRDCLMLFDESMTWLLDCDLFKRLYESYGEPVIINGANVVIGIHEGQMTNIISDEIKVAELNYLNEKL